MCQPVIGLAELALALIVTGEVTVAPGEGDETVTVTPGLITFSVSVWSPYAPVLSQARTTTVCDPTLIGTLALMEATLFWLQVSTLST